MFGGQPEYFCLFTFERVAESYTPLTTGPHELKPSDYASVLQYDSRPYNFVTQTLGIDIPLFILGTIFYFLFFFTMSS